MSKAGRMNNRREDEEKEALEWLSAHPEFAETDQDTRERRWVNGRNLTTYPIDPMVLAEVGEDDSLSEPGEYDPEASGGSISFRSLFPPAETRTPDQEALADRVAELFQRMRRRDVEILQRRFYERMTLDAIAAEYGITRQAVIKRLGTATKNLRRESDDSL